MSLKVFCLLASLTASLVLSICVASQQTPNAPPKEVAGIPVNYDEVYATDAQ